MQLWQYCLLVTARSLYMFRKLSVSIIRSTKNCSSSHLWMSLVRNRLWHNAVGNRPWTSLLDIHHPNTRQLFTIHIEELYVRSLYMFRKLSVSIIRSTKNCSSSHLWMSWVRNRLWHSAVGNRPWTSLLDIHHPNTRQLYTIDTEELYVRSLYMFRKLSVSIIRSTKTCSNSHWYMSWVGMTYIQ